MHHALNAALAEAAGNENAVVILESLFRGFGGVDFFGFDPVDNGFVVVREAAVEESFTQALVGVFELNVLADNGDADFALGVMKAGAACPARAAYWRDGPRGEAAG